MKSVIITSYAGFGDNIFIYPYIKEACKKYKTVYLETPFPFLFYQLANVKYIKPRACKTLKTCQQIINSYPDSFWTSKDRKAKNLPIPYYIAEFKKNGTLPEAFNRAIPIESKNIDYTIPIHPTWIKKAKKIFETFHTTKKICILKPPSNRKDWKNNARIPDVRYFQYIIDKYKSKYFFISIADRTIDNVTEELNNIDIRFENGELDLYTIIGLVPLCDLVLTYNCFLFPLGIATKTKTIVIGGGYSNPAKYIDFERMDLRNLKIITPDPPCECLNRRHDCNKFIPLEKIDIAFEQLTNKQPNYNINFIKPKKNLLISRMRAEQCHKIKNNPLIEEHFNIFTIDHTSLTPYKNLNLNNCFRFPPINDICRPELTQEQENQIYFECIKILKQNYIDQVINAQPLHPYHEQLMKACNSLGIKHINTETAFDGKWLFDSSGCQYTCPNDIYKYIDKMPLDNLQNIDLPKSSRQPQPDKITPSQFFAKYSLNPKETYIVIFGQLLWDMSVKKTVNKKINTYEEYIDLVVNSNPGTRFLIKHHPLYRGHHKASSDLKFFKKYPNIIEVYENLDTLFDIFNYFTSFSSTTVFEGIIKRKKFATIGFHYCNTDDLVFQLRINDKARNLTQSLKNLRIKEQTRLKYLKFVCDYYTINLSSPKLYSRLLMPDEIYFTQQL